MVGWLDDPWSVLNDPPDWDILSFRDNSLLLETSGEGTSTRVAGRVKDRLVQKAKDLSWFFITYMWFQQLNWQTFCLLSPFYPSSPLYLSGRQTFQRRLHMFAIVSGDTSFPKEWKCPSFWWLRMSVKESSSLLGTKCPFILSPVLCIIHPAISQV